jgi:hypothetical protein
MDISNRGSSCLRALARAFSGKVESTFGLKSRQFQKKRPFARGRRGGRESPLERDEFPGHAVLLAPGAMAMKMPQRVAREEQFFLSML